MEAAPYFASSLFDPNPKWIKRGKVQRLSLDEAKTTAAEFRTLSVYLQRGNGRILINRDIQYSEEPLTDVINDM